MLNKETIIDSYKLDLSKRHSNYSMYEVTTRPKVMSVAGLLSRRQIEYMRHQLYHIEQRMNSMLTSNYKNKSKQHLLIDSRSVIEKHFKVDALIHAHSVFAIHKDVERRFLKAFELREKKLFVRDDLMKKKFYELHDIEAQKLLSQVDVDNYVEYMFKHYSSSADEEQNIDGGFCFPASPIPSYRNAA